jgi:ABC-type multidrug transport system fused ATPase/permease subunit
MNDNILKVLKIIIALISAVAAYFFIRIIMVGDDAIIAGEADGIVGPFIVFAQWLLIIIASVAVLFSILSLLKKPEALKKTLLGLVVLGVLLGVSYGLASDEAVVDVTGQVLEGGEAGSSSKWVSTGIWYTFLLGACAIAAIVLGGVKSILK